MAALAQRFQECSRRVDLDYKAKVAILKPAAIAVVKFSDLDYISGAAGIRIAPRADPVSAIASC